MRLTFSASHIAMARQPILARSKLLSVIFGICASPEQRRPNGASTHHIPPYLPGYSDPIERVNFLPCQEEIYLLIGRHLVHISFLCAVPLPWFSGQWDNRQMNVFINTLFQTLIHGWKTCKGDIPDPHFFGALKEQLVSFLKGCNLHSHKQFTGYCWHELSLGLSLLMSTRWCSSSALLGSLEVQV